MEIVSAEIEKYLEEILPDRHALFRKMEEWATENKFPAVGPLVGQLLELLARLTNATRILELGSGFGYSGLWFARALPADGRIILTDFEPENRRRALENFKVMGLDHLLDFKVGNALDLMDTLDGPFDIVFNDVDKEDYPRIIEGAYSRLRRGGLLITDNTLWYGRVVGESVDQATLSVKRFNRELAAHPGFLTSLLPLRDGVSVSVKIQ